MALGGSLENSKNPNSGIFWKYDHIVWSYILEVCALSWSRWDTQYIASDGLIPPKKMTRKVGYSMFSRMNACAFTNAYMESKQFLFWRTDISSSRNDNAVVSLEGPTIINRWFARCKMGIPRCAWILYISYFKCPAAGIELPFWLWQAWQALTPTAVMAMWKRKVAASSSGSFSNRPLWTDGFRGSDMEPRLCDCEPMIDCTSHEAIQFKRRSLWSCIATNFPVTKSMTHSGWPKTGFSQSC